jgi:succinyl-CoA synthetase beta subunit
MKIHEYQAKDILRGYGVPTPVGAVAATVTEAVAASKTAGGWPVVVKAQVLVGGRGKAGGVKLAKNEAEVEAMAGAILGMDIKGEKVEKVLVERGLNIATEIYLGLILDRARKRPVFMASAAGGIDIEEVAAHTPEKILFLDVDPLTGLLDYQVREMAKFVGIPKSGAKGFNAIVRGLYKSFIDKDASLSEINPLVITGEGEVVAADAKINFDDNALYAHPEIEALRDPAEEAPLEQEARKAKLNYVKLDGQIGCMVNGAGLAMGTMDIVKHFGGSPANFLDIGGGAKAEQVTDALRIISSDPAVNTIFINIFGGIVRCDLVAEGILTALKNFPDWSIPIVIRLSGTNEEVAREMIKGTVLIPVATMSEGAKKSVEISNNSAK